MQATTISVEQYLATSYHPDVDYVDGQLEERNVGEKEHGKLQARLYFLLKRLKILVPFLETRLRVSESNCRVPDLCAYDTEPDEQVFTQPPALCIEVLSPEDRVHRIMDVVRDYLNMGVPTIWMFDPLQKKAYVVDLPSGLREVTGEIATADGRVALSLADVFSDRDLF